MCLEGPCADTYYIVVFMGGFLLGLAANWIRQSARL